MLALTTRQDSAIGTCSWSCTGHKYVAGLWANGRNDDRSGQIGQSEGAF